MIDKLPYIFAIFLIFKSLLYFKSYLQDSLEEFN